MMPRNPDSDSAIALAIVLAMKDPYTRILKSHGPEYRQDREFWAVDLA
jgi:hypothetical protein